MFFEKIKGNELVIGQLTQWLMDGSFNGVYLITGPKGIGKYTVARELSRYLICTGVSDPSCRCPSCKSFPLSADYLELSSTTEDMIKTSDVEEIERFIELLPSKGKRRIVLIDDAERLNSTAANKLLKVLEDVKNHLIFIMVSSHPDRIIPTVVSRSKLIRFNALSPQRTLEVLKEKGFSSKRVNDFRRAIPMLSHSVIRNFEEYSACFDAVQGFVDSFSKTDEDELLSTIEMWEKEGNLNFCIEMLLIFFSDILRIHLDDTNTVFNSDKKEIMERLSQVWSKEICVVALEKLRPVILDSKKGINLKLAPRVRSVVSWLKILMQKDK